MHIHRAIINNSQEIEICLQVGEKLKHNVAYKHNRVLIIHETKNT